MPFKISTGIGMANIQENVRSLLDSGGADSPNSLYSFTPILGSHDQAQRAPKRTSRRFTRQHLPGLRAEADHPDLPANYTTTRLVTSDRHPSDRHPSGRHPSDRHPSDRHPSDRHPSDSHPSDPLPDVDTQQDNNRDIERDGGSSNRSGHTKRHKKRRHHHRHHRYDHVWVRKRGRRGSSRTCSPLLHGQTRIKCISTVISGAFLAIILTVYLSLALTIHDLPQPVHILFILIVLASLIFFVHSIIRLCILSLRRPARSRRRHIVIPSVAGPAGFAPDVPIRVHLASDEEIAAQDDDGAIAEEKLESLKAPPPAYGLWRCSVRVDPALLHWQRAGSTEPARVPSRAGTPQPIPTAQGQERRAPRRPPSYMSDDGVEYVVSAEPRNTVYLPQPTNDIHPAYRACWDFV